MLRPGRGDRRYPGGVREALKAAFAADVGTLIDCRLDAQAYQDSFGPTIGVLDA